MDVVGVDSDDEYERELKSAVERYTNSRKPERKNVGEKKEGVKVRNKLPDDINENLKFLIDFADRGVKMKSYLREYEKQGAIPKGIYNEIKSNEMLAPNYSKGGKRRWKRGRSQSPAVRSLSCGKQFDRKSVTRERNSGLDKTVRSSNTNNTAGKACEKLLESFFYIVPEEPSPDFFLSPGTYYVVPKPLDLSTETVLVRHPPISKKDSPRNGSRTGKHRRKGLEQLVLCIENVNDVNKSGKWNCSNVTMARDLISEYNSGCSKADILSKIKTVKSNLEGEIEGFKSAVTEAIMALDQLKTLEFSLNCKVPWNKELGDKKINVDENEENAVKGTELNEESGAEVKPPDENSLINKEDGEGDSDLIVVENPSEGKELTPAQEERTVNDPTVSGDHDTLVKEYNEELLREEMINSQIVHITSVLPDISENYLRTELQKMGDDVNLINIFTNDLIENGNYPKKILDPEEDERKRLWKEFVTDFNPKKFLFEFAKNSSEDEVSVETKLPLKKFMADKMNEKFVKGAAARKSNDNNDVDLVLSFLRRRYPTVPPTKLRDEYTVRLDLAEVCRTLDTTVTPVRLSESRFWEEKFNREFLRKVTYLDHEKEIDDYLSEVHNRRVLEREEAKLFNAFLHCLTCYSEIVPSETTTCPEGHVFCSLCVEEYIRVELGKGIYRFKCLAEDCDALFSQTILEELLPTSELMKISIKQQAQEVMEAKVEGLESCSFCHFAYVPDSGDKIFKCRNSACMAEICRECGERNHIPLRCDEIERPKDLEARKKIEEAMTNTLLRTCPNCKKKVVKIDGCNKMTCTCGVSFCYLCGIQIYGYSHFGPKCPLHTNNTELHVRRVAEAGIQTRNELLKASSGVRIVHDPTKDF